MRYLTILGIALILCSGLQGQTLRWNTPSSDVQAKSPAATTTPSPISGQEVETGYVTYYADYLVNQPTASGEFYRHELLTAAHRTLPFGTLLKVTRLDNNASVTVRVNDRGTLCDGCVLSISRGAADALDMIKSGKITVAVQQAGFSNFSPRNEPALAVRSPYVTTAQEQPQAYEARADRYATATASSTPGWDPKYDDPNAARTQAARYPTQQATPVQPRAYGNEPRPVSPPVATSRTGVPESYDQRADYTRRPAASITPSQPQATTPSAYNQPMTATTPTAPAAYDQLTARSPITPANSAGAAPVGEVQIAANNVQGFGIQLGAFGNFANAERRVVSLQQQGVDNVFIKQDADGSLSRVIVGPFASSAVAKAELQRLEAELDLKGLVMSLR